MIYFVTFVGGVLSGTTVSVCLKAFVLRGMRKKRGIRAMSDLSRFKVPED